MNTRSHSEIRDPKSEIQSSRGLLIAFEGIDGAGKTTLACRLTAYLRDQGYDAIQLKEPTDGLWGRRIRNLAASGREGVSPREELDLFLRDRKENVTQNIRPALEAGKLVIVDRYYYSSMAYQGARGLDPEEIRKANEAFAVVPDLVFIVDIPSEVALPRISECRGEKPDHFEDEPYLRRVREVFRSIEGENVHRIDGTRCVQTVFDEVRRIAEETLERWNVGMLECSCADG